METVYGNHVFREVNSDTEVNADDQVMVADAAAGGFNITPLFSPNYPGRWLIVHKVDLTTNPIGISNTNIVLITPGETVKIMSIGFKWIKVSV